MSRLGESLMNFRLRLFGIHFNDIVDMFAPLPGNMSSIFCGAQNFRSDRRTTHHKQLSIVFVVGLAHRVVVIFELRG
jgi:hypothetical protein